MQIRLPYIALSLLLVASITSLIAAENWPRFRGPNANGLHLGADLPTTWNESENIVWKSKTPGKGHSSPVIWGDEIWMATAMNEGHDLHALCFSRKGCLLYTSPSPRDATLSRMPSSA